ncbi:MAG: hypothetical protein DDG60_15670, partial [Anaerolineae bacterium]
MSRLALTLSLLLVLLAACQPATTPALNPTITQSRNPTITQSPNPSITQSPNPTITQTPTPTPERITLTKTFGLDAKTASEFAGAENFITRA